MLTVKNDGWWLFLMGMIAAAALTWPEAGWAQQQKKTYTIQVRPMLKIGVIITPDGGEVRSVNLAGPAGRMTRADNPNIRGIMEVGDIITKVCDKPVKTLEDLRDGLAAGGKVVITVWDKRSRREIDWIVKPE